MRKCNIYEKRIKVFISLATLCLLVCLLRLAQLQIHSSSFYHEKINNLKDLRSYTKQFNTLRGRILDRKNRVIAADEPKFQLEISYHLTSVLDPRATKAKLLRVAQRQDSAALLVEAQKELHDKQEKLNRIIEKCTYFGYERVDIEEKIKQINDQIWNLRTFLAWRRSSPDPEIIKKYSGITSVPLSAAISDFEKRFSNPNDRLIKIGKVDDIVEMNRNLPFLELKSDEDIFTAQLEFMENEGIGIRPEGKRVYPYDSTAAQTIGWVGLPQSKDEKLFADDRLSSYITGEVCGREDGVEYICEGILRGRRGEVVYDIDRQLRKHTETRFGRDVHLTIDIELQKKIEQHLSDKETNPNNYNFPMAAVVIDVASGDILAMVSLPTYDLNRARYDYGDFERDPGVPLINRAIYELYPPGSVIKPVIYIAGAESGKITAETTTSCPARNPPKGWPRCWLHKKYSWLGHDEQFSGMGGNKARNAIRGSCNIYFSRLAARIEPMVLQKWLYSFGYGQKILPGPVEIAGSEFGRNLRQSSGAISSTNPQANDPDFIQLPELKDADGRWFGIGQGNLRVTVLQVAGAMATIARGGLYKEPRLFEDANEQPEQFSSLDISPKTLKTVRDGMRAVISESHGTAYNEFRGYDFAAQGVTIFGKTGSTEAPEHAWFAGFAEESGSRSIALAVLVEKGEHGSEDAAPLARDIIQFCIDDGYLGGKEQRKN